jgi:hypothetical protein
VLSSAISIPLTNTRICYDREYTFDIVLTTDADQVRKRGKSQRPSEEPEAAATCSWRGVEVESKLAQGWMEEPGDQELGARAN